MGRRMVGERRGAATAVMKVLTFALLAAAACSSTDDAPDSGNVYPGQGATSPGGTGSTGTAGGGTSPGGTGSTETAAGATSPGGTGSTGTAGGAGNTGGSGAGAATSGGAAGGAGATSGGTSPSTDAGSSGTMNMADCTPSAWKDPGTVPNPELVSVTAKSGNDRLLGKSKGIEAFGYVQEEFFFTGTSPAYTSRMIVNRPSDPAKFSGTVFVEWLNVSGGIDVAALWAVSREYAMREGHVYVNVSAQKVGADALKNFDAERYAPIDHPGDGAANDVFAQAAMAIRAQSEKLLGRCMPVDAVIGIGQSQSSFMLGAYISDAHPDDRIYDGYMLHSNPFGGPPSDPDVPVFVVATMNEADGSLVDDPNIVEWEVAGASHNDAHLTERGNAELGSALGITLECANPLNNYPAFWAYNAALSGLNRWVRERKRPSSGDPIQSGMVDEHGNSVGGVRLPDLDVPVASYTSSNGPKDIFDLIAILGCGLGGSVEPFAQEKLLRLYPTHEAYVQKYKQAADAALAKGHLLQADYEIAIRKAEAAPIPR